MKLSANTIGLFTFIVISSTAFVYMAKRPPVEGNAISFGMPVNKSATENNDSKSTAEDTTQATATDNSTSTSSEESQKTETESNSTQSTEATNEAAKTE